MYRVIQTNCAPFFALGGKFKEIVINPEQHVEEIENCGFTGADVYKFCFGGYGSMAAGQDFYGKMLKNSNKIYIYEQQFNPQPSSDPIHNCT